MWTCNSCGAPVVEQYQSLLRAPDHPFPNLLETNDVPSPADIPLIQEDTRQIEARAYAVDAEIARLREIIARCKRVRRTLRKRLDSNRGSVSALRRFPSELLSHILIECLPDDVSDIHAAVLRLGSVCRRWWAVALSTPQLWTSVYPGNRSARFASANVWIQRSGSLPLSLVYRHKYSPEIVPLIVFYASRWGRLELKMPNIPADLREGVTEGFPSLRSLSLDIDDKLSNFDGDMPMWDLTTSPKLHEVLYSSYSDAMQSMGLPWGQLTHLTLENQAQPTCLDILAAAPNLVECNFLHIFDREEIWNRQLAGPVLLPCMRRLQASCEYAHSSIRLFEFTTMPLLEELIVSSVGTDAVPDNSVLSFLQRSRCNLT
ncbi:hypothetical protein PLICRDRAFT_234417 [Plicaturopsis crispa FD-325 SS-3]|nr:hypothetical protein PLICRDRAFT_234417 [Plicaturopsis crispa FD-325 SS-3]